MSTNTFDRETTLADILRSNPALIEVLDRWNLHLVPSTVVALIAPLHKAANWHAIFDVDKLLKELNEKRDLNPVHMSPKTNGSPANS
jgi:hypothetical protein